MSSSIKIRTYPSQILWLLRYLLLGEKPTSKRLQLIEKVAVISYTTPYTRNRVKKQYKRLLEQKPGHSREPQQTRFRFYQATATSIHNFVTKYSTGYSQYYYLLFSYRASTECRLKTKTKCRHLIILQEYQLMRLDLFKWN